MIVGVHLETLEKIITCVQERAMDALTVYEVEPEK